jgi:hypothetical protein
MVKSLRAQGAKAIEIMRQAGIGRGLANKWLQMEECPPRAKRTSRPGMAEDFRDGDGNRDSKTESSCLAKSGSLAIAEATLRR